MAVYRIHVPLDDHVGQKTGRVRSCTKGARIEAPAGEFSDLRPGADYNRIDTRSDEPIDDPTDELPEGETSEDEVAGASPDDS